MENVVQIEVWNGARLAIITANDACGPFTNLGAESPHPLGVG